MTGVLKKQKIEYKRYSIDYTQDRTSLQAQLQTIRSYNITKAFIWVQEAEYLCFYQLREARAEAGSSQQPSLQMLNAEENLAG